MKLQYKGKRTISVYCDKEFFQFEKGVLEIDGRNKKAIKLLLENPNIEKLEEENEENETFKEETENEVQ